MAQPSFNVNHHYNQTLSTAQYSNLAQQSITSNDSTTLSTKQQSFRQQIEMILLRCQQIQREKQQSQSRTITSATSTIVDQLQQQPSFTLSMIQQINSNEHDEFDRIMEEDLENQLKELEREEEKQFELLEQSVEEEFKRNTTMDYSTLFTSDYIQQLKHLEAYICHERQQHQQQYEALLKQINKLSEQHRPVYQWNILKKFSFRSEQV
jgi:hypothetical protein